MAFNNSFTAVTGATYTAAQYNTHTRDNFAAVWVYTTAGDISYATSATTLARLGIGTEYYVLRSASGIPAWDRVLQFAKVYKSTTQNFSNGSAADIAWNAEETDPYGWHDNSTNNTRITVGANGWYKPTVGIHWTKDSGGDETIFHMTVKIQLNGSDTANQIIFPGTKNILAKRFTFGGIPVQMTAGQYLTVNFSQDSGGTGTLYDNATRNTFTVERVG